MTPRQIAAIGAAGILLATPLVAAWEGDGGRVGYLDIVGVPTYCYGGTGPAAIVGKHYTAAECQTQLARDVERHARPLQDCVTAEIRPEVFAALISLSYNIGPAGVCSTAAYRPPRVVDGVAYPRPQGLVWKLNRGDVAGACADFAKFNTSKGKVVRGLTNRRAAERRLCEKGLNP